MSRLGLVAALLLATLVGCAARGPQLATVSEVDLERFMGDWYDCAKSWTASRCKAPAIRRSTWAR